LKKINVLVVSAYKYGNAGDDICALSTKYAISKAATTIGKIEITSPPIAQNLLKDKTVVVLGGGGLIYDTDKANVKNYMDYFKFAEPRTIKAAISMGVQGIASDYGREQYKKYLSKLDVLSVRSESDKALLNEIGINNAVTTQDIAFLADNWLPKWSSPRKYLYRKRKPIIGLSLVDLKKVKGESFKKFISNFEKIIDDFINRNNDKYDFWFLQHSGDDKGYIDRLKSKHKITVINYKSPKDISKLWWAYKQVDYVIGVRFHSIILAILAKKPILPIGSKGGKQYRLCMADDKVLKKQYVDLNQLDDLKRKLSLFSDPAVRLEAAETSKVKELQILAEKNVDLLKAALRGANK